MGRQIEQAAGDRFLELYGHLLAYVNTKYNEVSDIETYADVREQQDTELRPIRTRLYEEDTERLIADFVAEPPVDLDDDELEAVEQWTDYTFGEFVVVRHLDEYGIFLDWEAPPQAFGVKTARHPFDAYWEEGALPLLVSQAALLPFEETIVTDGWLAIQPIVFGGSISTDSDDAYEEAKHRFGIIETLPVPDEESETSDAEQLRFYMKNKRNRERYADEIETLKTKSPVLERIYHEELGEAWAANCVPSISTRRTSPSTTSRSSLAVSPRSTSSRSSTRSCPPGNSAWQERLNQRTEANLARDAVFVLSK